MKKTLILLALLVSSTVYSAEEKTILKCNGANCYKESRITEVKKNNVEIKLSQLTSGMCLVDLEKEETFKIIEADQKSKKIIMVQETTEGDLVILKRILKFYNDKSFNRQLRILPCAQTDTKVFVDEERTQKCLKTSSKYAQKYFCAKERLTNF